MWTEIRRVAAAQTGPRWPLIILFCTWALGVAGQYHHVETFSEEDGTLIGEAGQFHSCFATEEGLLIGTIYNGNAIFNFDGHHLFQGSDLSHPDSLRDFQPTILPDWSSGQFIVASSNGKHETLYKHYDEATNRWISLGRGSISPYGKPFYVRVRDGERPTLFVVEADTAKLGQYTLWREHLDSQTPAEALARMYSSVNLFCLNSEGVFYGADNALYLQRYDTSPVQHLAALPVTAQLDDRFAVTETHLWLVRSSGECWAYPFAEGKGGRWRHFPAFPNYSLLRSGITIFPQAGDRLILVLRGPKKLEDKALVVLDAHEEAPLFYPFRGQEILSVAEMAAQGRIWMLSASGIHCLYTYLKATDPGRDNYPDNVWGTVSDTFGNTVFPAYATNPPLAIYEGKSGQMHLDTNWWKSIPAYFGNSHRPFLSPVRYKDGVLVMLEGNGVLFYDARKRRVMDYYRLPAPPFMLRPSPKDGRWWLAGGGWAPTQINLSKGADLGSGFEPLDVPETTWRTRALTHDAEGRAWVAGSGLAVYSAEGELLKAYSAPGKFTAFSVASDAWGGIWVGFSKDGLYHMQVKARDLPDASALKACFSASSQKHEVFSLAVVQDTFLLIGDKRRIGILHLPTFYATKRFEPSWLDKLDGSHLATVEQSCFNQDADAWVWASSTSGRTLKINVSEAWRFALGRQRFRAGLKSFEVLDNKDKPMRALAIDDGPIKLGTGERRIRLSLFHKGAAQYHSRYVYELYRNGELEDRDTIDGATFPYTLLKPGKYRLKLWPQDINGVDYAESPLELKWTASASLTEQPYFWLVICGLVISAIVFAIDRRKALRAKRKAEAEAQHWFVKVFSAHVNMHFLSNALEMLRGRIGVWGGDESKDFVYRLGSNVRIVYDCAKQGEISHSLAKEMEIVRNNVHFHKLARRNELRQDGEAVTLPDAADLASIADVQVPLHSIVTHIDNAFEHGLKRMDDMHQGWVKLSIEDGGDHIHIEIMDNGVGRMASAGLGRGNQEAENLQRQLRDKLNPSNQQHITNTHEALYPDGRGNIQRIIIPKTYRYAH